MATKARQQYFADENSLQKQRREFSIADDIQQKIDSIEEGAQVNVIETVKVNGTPLIPDANKAVNVEVPEVIDNLYTIDSDNALSAKQGKILYDYIQNIASRGRFLSNWNSATGLPMTNPSESPYLYKSGDYFVVSNVAASGGTNYRPDGSSYIIGQASTVVETEDVSVSDFYFYDGTNWLLLSNSGRQIAVDSSLSATSTNPVENRVITNALNGKQDTLIAGSHIDITSNVVSTTGLQEELTAGDNITIEDICTTESDMQGPAPDGFHVPLNTEWQAVKDIRVALGGGSSDGANFGIALKLPFAGNRSRSNAGIYSQGSHGYYWSSSRSDASNAYYLFFFSTAINPQSTYLRANGQSVRCFKNSPTVPTSSWTKLYGTSIEAGGIFWSSTDGLISLSSDGQTWVTIADKNLGATTVWNSGDTLSEANCGKYYQWGNNYGFPFTGSVTTSSTQVDASNYGPGNYYSSSTFIIYTGRWDSTDNGNLWGGVTQGTWQDCALTISATDTTYTASDFDIKDLTDSTNLRTTWSGKQDKMSSGNNVSIDGITINARDTEYTEGSNITITCPVESDTKGPCPSGFHVPLQTEWATIKNIWTTLGGGANDGSGISVALKLPFAGYRYALSGNTSNTGSSGLYASSSIKTYRQVYYLYFDASSINAESVGCSTGAFTIRPFKNVAEAPDSTWTTILDGSSVATGAGIFYNATLGLISLSGDGTTWYTIADKNLGATQVWTNGDTLSEINCGKYYQTGNNYGFDGIGGNNPTTSRNYVNAAGYGPGNYYCSSTYIIGSDNWDRGSNSNLWGGVTQGTWQDCEHPIISAAVSPTDINVKTFYPTGDNDTTTFSEIANRYLAGKNPLISYKNQTYTLQCVFDDITEDNFLDFAFINTAFIGTATNGKRDEQPETLVPLTTRWISFRTSLVGGVSTPGHISSINFSTAGLDDYLLQITGNKAQTINGTKTFATSPIVPSKTAAATNDGTAIATEAQVYNVASNVNTKTFMLPYDLSSAAAVAVAQEALDWYRAGGNPILYHLGGWDQVPMPRTYYLSYAFMPSLNLELVFVSQESHVDEQSGEWGGYDDLNFFRIHLLTNSTTTLADATTVTTVSEDRVTGSSFYVNLRGAQTIGGTKTFTTSPVVPNKITDATNDGTAVATEAQVYNVDNKTTRVSATAPSSPTEGMVWYDTTNDVLKTYDGTNWNEAGGGAEYNAGKGIEIGTIQDYSAMQGPAPEGYHIPLSSEWGALCGILTTTFSMADNATTMGTYLKMPKAGRRSYSSSNVETNGYYWSSIAYSADDAYYLFFASLSLNPQYKFHRTNGCSIRCFKNTPVVPTSSWTTLYDGSSVATGAGVFYNASLGLISVSGDGTTWYTIMDKNLGATTVYNEGDTLTDANCGYFYQWGNNYGFPHSGTVTTSSTKVDASNYGPGNYYNSSTFITASASPYDWSSVQNDNLRGGVTGIVTLDNAISNTGVLSVNGQTGDVTITTPEESNTKTFYISSASDLTTAQAALDWYKSGNNPIVSYNDEMYYFKEYQDSFYKKLWFYKDSLDVLELGDYTMINRLKLGFDLDDEGTTVTGIRDYNYDTIANLLDTSTDYSSPYTPVYDGSPATKKYVDDSVSGAVSKGTTAPSSPVEGQLWYDTTNDVLKVYDGTNWNNVNTDTTYTAGTGINIDANNVISSTITPGQTYTAGNGINIDSNNKISNTLPGAIVSATAPSSPTEGMVWYDTTNDVLKTYDGTQWNEISGGVEYTAGDNIIIDDDNEISAIDTTYNAGPGIEIGTHNNYSAMQGPCQDGFHIPNKDDLLNLNILLSNIGNIYTELYGGNLNEVYELNIPPVGFVYYDGVSSPNRTDRGTISYTWVSDGGGYQCAEWNNSSPAVISPNDLCPMQAMPIRAFKDKYVTPDSSRTTDVDMTQDAKDYEEKEGDTGRSFDYPIGIFHNSTLGIITFSDGTTCMTIADKNLGATTTWNDGDNLTTDNCGNIYQWGNCYGFTSAEHGTTGYYEGQKDASNYGPGNYYSSSEFVYPDNGSEQGLPVGKWDSSDNQNLRGGETGVITTEDAITNTGVLSVNNQTGAVTVSEFTPGGTATTGYVVTKTANGYEWSAPSGGDVVVSTQTGNILQSGMKIWAGLETDYQNLGSYDQNTLYLTI